MALDLRGIRAAVESHALAGGHLDRLDSHETDSAPGQGLSASVALAEVTPIRGRSGLASTTVLVTLSVRIALPVTHEPADDIDPILCDATDALMRAYSGDFDLGTTAAEVDLLGAHSTGLRARWGYLPYGDDQLYRVADITLPLVVDDLWTQAP